MYDIVIVGAGPSGSILASFLDPKYKVLILDKRTVLYNDLESQLKLFSDDDMLCGKCCGGLLAPNSQKVLASIGLPFPKDILVSPQVFGLKVIDVDNNLSGLYSKSYININRKKFDKWLLDKALKKSNVIQGATYKRSKKTKDGYEITYMQNGKEYKEHARLIVGADGAYSRIRNEFFSEVKLPQKYVAVQEWYKIDSIEPYYYSFSDKKVTDYYSWIIPKENYIILGSAMNDLKNANQKFNLLKEDLKKYGFEFSKSNFVRKEGSMIFRPRSLKEIALVKDNVALVGEASGIISPSSSEGISYALRSGITLAEELNKDFELGLKRYKKKASILALKAVSKNIRNPFLYGNFARKLIMKSRIKTIKER